MAAPLRKPSCIRQRSVRPAESDDEAAPGRSMSMRISSGMRGNAIQNISSFHPSIRGKSNGKDEPCLSRHVKLRLIVSLTLNLWN